MDWLAALLAQAVRVAPQLGALAGASITDFSTSGALTCGGYASAVGVSVAVAIIVVAFVGRLTASATS